MTRPDVLFWVCVLCLVGVVLLLFGVSFNAD